MADKTMSVVSFQAVGASATPPKSANVLCAFTHEADAKAPGIDLFTAAGLLCRAASGTDLSELIVPSELLKIAEFKLDEGLIASPRTYCVVDGSPQRIVAPVAIQSVDLTAGTLTIKLNAAVLEESTAYALVAAEGETPRLLTRHVRPTDPPTIAFNDLFASGTYAVFALVDGLIPLLMAKKVP